MKSLIFNMFERIKFNIMYVIGSCKMTRGGDIPGGAITDNSKGPTPPPLSQATTGSGVDCGSTHHVVCVGVVGGVTDSKLALDSEQRSAPITKKTRGRRKVLEGEKGDN